MAIPHDAYMKLKILKIAGPNGVITVSGATKNAHQVEVANLELAEA